MRQDQNKNQQIFNIAMKLKYKSKPGVLKVGGKSGPVTDKCRWPGSDLGGPDQNSMNHIFNYYFANEILKKTTVYYFTVSTVYFYKRTDL